MCLEWPMQDIILRWELRWLQISLCLSLPLSTLSLCYCAFHPTGMMTWVETQVSLLITFESTGNQWPSHRCGLKLASGNLLLYLSLFYLQEQCQMPKDTTARKAGFPRNNNFHFCHHNLEPKEITFIVLSSSSRSQFGFFKKNPQNK